MQEDITELAKRVLELKLFEARFANAAISQEAWLSYEQSEINEILAGYKQYTDCLPQAAPKLAQAVLELKEIIRDLDIAAAIRLAELNAAKAEIAALRPDAQAWREREARYQAEKQEMLERMGK